LFPLLLFWSCSQDSNKYKRTFCTVYLISGLHFITCAWLQNVSRYVITVRYNNVYQHARDIGNLLHDLPPFYLHVQLRMEQGLPVKSFPTRILKHSKVSKLNKIKASLLVLSSRPFLVFNLFAEFLRWCLSQILMLPMVGQSLNNESKSIWKDTVVAQSRYHPRIYTKRLSKTTKVISQDRRCLGWNSNEYILNASSENSNYANLLVRYHLLSTFPTVQEVSSIRSSDFYWRGDRFDSRVYANYPMDFLAFPQSFQKNAEAILWTKPRQVPLTSFQIHHSSVNILAE
jgi:hypothetical protein